MEQVCSSLSCLTLFCPVDCSPPGSSVHEILQARVLEWVAIFLLQGSSGPRIEPLLLVFPVSAGGFFTSSGNWEAPGGGGSVKKNYLLFSFQLVKWKSLSCVRLFATPWTIYIVHGILQARMLEWVAFPFSRGSSQPRDQTQLSSMGKEQITFQGRQNCESKDRCGQ